MVKNLTEIDWAHAVNNRSYLDATLNSNIAMIEADIVLGHMSGAEDGPTIPIMAHPPAMTSDLSLEEFLATINEFNKNAEQPKGVKLDFKSIAAFEAAQNEIALYTQAHVDYPIWLNADILAGPVDATTTPVDPVQFLKLCANHKVAVLSIGWTTSWNNEGSGSYLKDHVEDMIKILKENMVDQTVTYPVRAAIVAHSLETMQYLLDATKHLNPTLTVWSGETDLVDADRLKSLMLTIGLDKTYLDVPMELKQRLDLPSQIDD